MMRYLIGVDNTDTAKAPGTSLLVRRLAEGLLLDGSAVPIGITRHQLLQHRKIPYTGRNSSVCLSIETENMEEIWETARDFLLLESAPKSDTGLCMCRSDAVTKDVIAFGKRAKSKVLSVERAQEAASKARLRCVGLKGDGSGVVGALAAVGLHRDGNDGRFVWMPGLPELQGTLSVAEILQRTTIDRVCTLEELEVATDALIDIGEWPRPLLRNGQATLYVKHGKTGWSVLEKDQLKSLSD